MSYKENNKRNIKATRTWCKDAKFHSFSHALHSIFKPLEGVTVVIRWAYLRIALIPG